VRRAATRRTLAAAVGVVLLGSGVALALPARARTPLLASSAVGRTPSAVAVDPRSGHVFVANSTDNTVSMLDARTGRVLHTTAVGGDPDQLQINPRTERVFVLNHGDGSVSVLDARTGTMQRTLRLGQGSEPAVAHPHAAIFVFDGINGIGGSSSVPGTNTTDLVAVQDAPQGTWLRSIAVLRPGWEPAVDDPTQRLFVPDMADDSVDLFDPMHGQYLRSIGAGAMPVAVAADPRTGHAFVAGMGPLPPAHPASSVSVFDLHSGRVLATLAVGPYPALVAVDGPAGRVLVVHGWGRPADAGPGSLGGGTDVLDARTGRVIATLAAGGESLESLALEAHLPLVAVDERRSHSFMLEPAAGRVSVVDDRTARVLRSVAVAGFPIALAVDAPAARLFVVHRYADCHARSSGAWALLPASVRRWLRFFAPPAPPPGTPQLACASHGSVSVFDLARL
jgi:YVTN family beta-propeller protein